MKRILSGVLATMVLATALAAEPMEPQPSAPFPAPRRALRWINPGETGGLAANGSYLNELGQLGVLNATGAVDATGHPFFAALGTNGRACVSCHQPQDAMSLSLDSIRQQWRVTQGSDPIFAAVDGKNCPHLPQGEPASHSLLLNRGLFRVFLPWPPRDARGRPIAPEFSIEVLRDPTGCNTHPAYGLDSPNPTVSVYRRPRPAANTKYTTHPKMNLMADARAPSLRAQAADAAATHMERAEPLTPAQLDGIVSFESQVYIAQVIDRKVGNLVAVDGASALGPQRLQRGSAGMRGNATTRPVFPLDESWTGQGTGDPARASIVRGRDLFMTRGFRTDESGELRRCASCHGAQLSGMDIAHRWTDSGTSNVAATVGPSPLPLFKLACKESASPHATLGRVIYTQDPGRALITGKCRDVGAFVTQQLRGLAARSPYFASGSAATLREVVDFYDSRYRIGFSEQEKQDLTSFLGVL